MALASYLLFKKSRQNFTENLVLNLFLLYGILTISAFMQLVMIFTDNRDFLLSLNNFLAVLTIFYVIIFNYQYFSVFDYKKHQIMIRAVIIGILYLTIKLASNVFLLHIIL